MTKNSILIVEPDPLVRQPLAEYLRECGYLVLEAINTDEALLVLNESGVAVDIVIADVNKSGQLDGFALARWIRQNRPGLEVILAGTVEKAIDTAAHLCENGPVMEKPYHHALLLDRIKAALAARDRLARKGGRG